MKGQGTGLWLVAIGLIAVFMLATMVAPAMLNPTSERTSDGGNKAPQPLTFKAPTVESPKSVLDQDDSTDMTVSSITDSSTTGEGGEFVWVLSVQGANGQGNAIQMKYGDRFVQWFGASNGALVGVGPTFSQGPGAVPVEVTASFTVTPVQAGEYTIEAWVAQAPKIATLDPTGLQAVSPTSSQSLVVNEKVKPDVSVTQNLSDPGIAREGKAVEFTLSSKGTALGKWNGSLIDRIIILKSKISPSDVTVRVNGAKISLTKNGDSLVGDLQTVRPFDGASKTETAEWSIKVEINFLTAGDYTVEGSSVDAVSKKVLYTTDGQTVKVSKSISSTPTPPLTSANTGSNATAPSASSSGDSSLTSTKNDKNTSEAWPTPPPTTNDTKK